MKLILCLVCYVAELFEISFSKLSFICAHSRVVQVRVKVTC
jgi:hypothetical protein